MKIEQPKIIAQSQEYIFDELHIIGGAKEELKAIVSFVINDENGKRIDTKVIEYKGEDYNSFWENFNSGKFLYDELVEKEGFDVEVDEDVENTFVNKTESVLKLRENK